MEIITQVDYEEIISKFASNEEIVIREKMLARLDFGIYSSYRAIFEDCIFADCKIPLDLPKPGTFYFFDSIKVNCQVSGVLNKGDLYVLLNSLKGNTIFENVSIDGRPITIHPISVNHGRGWILDDSFFYLGVLKTFDEWANITAKEMRSLRESYAGTDYQNDCLYFIEKYEEIIEMFSERQNQFEYEKISKP